MDDKFECRGKWFLSIIRTIFQLVKFSVGNLPAVWKIPFNPPFPRGEICGALS
jgi:hypothetical protein